MKNALFHVGLAKCASTYFGDQILKASSRGEITATYWHPWDSLINSSFAEVIGNSIVAFPNAGDGICSIDYAKHFIASNECLTGHFPQPLRMVTHPLYSGEHLREFQANVAHRLKAITDREFSGFRVKILLITRAPESWLRSVYKNLVLMGVSQSPDEYFKVFGDVLVQWINVDYLGGIYKGFFGADNVLILPFEMLCEDPDSFAGKINSFAGTDIVLDNDAKNTGLSDNATEYFRRFWMEVDKMAPPLPDWGNSTVQYKQQTWEFIHNTILNDREKVAVANATLSAFQANYKMPQDVIQQIRGNMQTLKNEACFSAYLAHYFG